MKLTMALRDGGLGVRWELPRALRVLEETEDRAVLLDMKHQLQWWLLWFPEMSLGLGADEGRDAVMEEGMRHYARAMFEWVFRQLRRDASGDASGVVIADELMFEETPKTAEPGWTPMVDCERVRVEEAAALRTTHRMSYSSGDERVMGHVLVPLRGGLLEVRMVGKEAAPGTREATVMRESGALASGAVLRQEDYDDPRYDELLPEHALSRVRAAQRWVIRDAGLRVLEPAEVHAGGEVVLEALECALVAPPRFALLRVVESSCAAVFERVAFCGTDGVERMMVRRVDEQGIVSAAVLPVVAERYAQEQTGPERRLAMEEVVIGDRSCVLVVVDDERNGEAVRDSMCWLRDDAGRAYVVMIVANAVVPASVRREELRAVVATWRSTRG